MRSVNVPQTVKGTEPLGQFRSYPDFLERLLYVCPFPAVSSREDVRAICPDAAFDDFPGRVGKWNGRIRPAFRFPQGDKVAPGINIIHFNRKISPRRRPEKSAK